MSLRLKMILGMGAILLLVILVFAILASSSQSNHQLDMAAHEARLIAAIAERALSRAMGQGDTAVVEAILTRIGEQRVLAGIRIVAPDGKILRSNRAEEVGRVLPLRERPEAGIPEVVSDLKEGTVGVFRPIANGPSCVRCHPQNVPILGFLNPRVYFPTSDADSDRQWSFMIVAGVGGLLVAGGMIWLLFTYVVGQRIDGLAQTMGRVESGDLMARVVDDNRDELGRLASSFNTMVARLADARRQLEDRHAEEIRRAENLASLGKMAAGIAHEINNPIAGMLNCVRTLLKGVKSDERRVQYLEMLRDGLDRIGRTVGQLLNFARESKPRLAKTSLAPLLKHCLTLLEHDLAARQVSPSLKLDNDLPLLLADPHQLEQVFLNILMNALEAMPEGGRLAIRAEVAKRDNAPCVTVSVSDTGTGIAAEDLPRIFDPFFTTKDVGKGTGLGLSVSYGIIQTHGGSIHVESEVARGTTVAVSLPVNGK